MPSTFLQNLRQFAWHGTRFLKYWLNAIDEYSLQPPFIYRFYREVIKPDSSHPVFENIENERKNYLKNSSYIHTRSPGPPSMVNPSPHRQVKDIARNSLTSPKYCRLLHRLIQWKTPEVVVELGTSLGISTLYLHEGCPRAKVYTFEGCPETSKKAAELFARWNQNTIHLITGNINDQLPRYLDQWKQIDVVFIDANHQMEPTLHYFNLLWPKISEGGILIIDDIHWSPSMEKAWEAIKSTYKVPLTIDIFKMGMLINQPGLMKQDYVLSF